MRFGSLKDLDDALRFLIAFQRTKQEQKVGRVACLIVVAGARMGRDQHPFARLEHPLQQPAVALLIFGAVGQAGLPQVDLVLQIDAALIERPNGPAHGRQGRNDAIEQRVVILLRSHVGLGKLRDLAHQSPNLLLCLFDEFGIDRLFRAHAIFARRRGLRWAALVEISTAPARMNHWALQVARRARAGAIASILFDNPTVNSPGERKCPRSENHTREEDFRSGPGRAPGLPGTRRTHGPPINSLRPPQRWYMGRKCTPYSHTVLAESGSRSLFQ